jgi:DNA-binding LytR/AlgR family response regulator
VNLAHVKEIRPDFRSTFSLLMADAAKTVIEVSERQARALRERIPGL